MEFDDRYQEDTMVKKERQEQGSEFFQITAILIACLSSLTAGMLFSWPSPSIPIIINDKSTYDISLAQASYFTVLPPIAFILFSVLISKIMDAVGRKYVVLSMAVPYLAAWYLTACAKSVYVFYIARFISGIGNACLYSALPVYVGEVATPKVRGTWGNALNLFVYLGQTMINIVGSYTTIEQSAYICSIVPLIFAASFIFMPETPYYYLMKNRPEQARKSLQKLRGKKIVDEELTNLQSDLDRQMSESGTWKDLVLIAANRKALCAGIFLRVSQQMGGMSSMVVYCQYIFAKATGSDLSASTSAIIFNALCCILTFVAAFTLDRIGRRRSYFLSCLLSAIALLLLSLYFFVEQFYPDVNLKSLNWFPLCSMILCVIFYSFGLGIVPTLSLSELFSSSIKAKGLCITSITYGVMLSTVTKIFHLLDTGVGSFAPFLLFSVSCFVSAILTLRFVPESKGKTLEEIQQSLRNARNH